MLRKSCGAGAGSFARRLAKKMRFWDLSLSRETIAGRSL
jgi:hypothetical protein